MDMYAILVEVLVTSTLSVSTLLCCCVCMYRIAGVFRGRLLSQMAGNCDFREGIFLGIVRWFSSGNEAGLLFANNIFVHSNRSAKLRKDLTVK